MSEANWRDRSQQEIIDKAFQLLDDSMKAGNYTNDPLPGHVKAEDFMLMSLEPIDGHWRFKNIDTRNYILVDESNGEIDVPKIDAPFMRGEFYG